MEHTVAADATIAVDPAQKFEADGKTPRAEVEHREAKQSRERLLENNTPAAVGGCARTLAF